MGKHATESFRSLGTLRVLNVLAVGLSLGGVTGGIIGRMFSSGGVGLLCALSTFVFGVAWAALLRSRKRIGSSALRWGWAASVPLAAANAATACAVLLAQSEPNLLEGVVRGAILGATIGSIVWVPALVATLICFGYPISWAQKRAQQGLAGEERGERVVGLISAAIGVVGIALTIHGRSHDINMGELEGEPTGTLWLWYLVAAIALAGLSTGGVAAAFAKRRERVRRTFLREVEQGAVTGYRIAESPEGKVLMRVTSMGEGYRVANFEEPLCALDEEGEARKPLALTHDRY